MKFKIAQFKANQVRSAPLPVSLSRASGRMTDPANHILLACATGANSDTDAFCWFLQITRYLWNKQQKIYKSHGVTGGVPLLRPHAHTPTHTNTETY